MGLRMEYADSLVAVPIALDLEAVLIQPTTTITMAQTIWIVILKRFLCHAATPPKQDSLPDKHQYIGISSPVKHN